VVVKADCATSGANRRAAGVHRWAPRRTTHPQRRPRGAAAAAAALEVTNFALLRDACAGGAGAAGLLVARPVRALGSFADATHTRTLTAVSRRWSPDAPAGVSRADGRRRGRGPQIHCVRRLELTIAYPRPPLQADELTGAASLAPVRDAARVLCHVSDRPSPNLLHVRTCLSVLAPRSLPVSGERA
jgi:hypothetical protein